MVKLSFARIWPGLALLAILVIGAVLRIVPLEQRDYWYDEAFTGITVRQPFVEMMDIIVHDVHPPFYYWTLKAWTLVAGSSPLAIRLFSVMFGVAIIALVFVALREWSKKSWWPALLGALFVAINPFFVNYSQEARMYALLGFLLMLAVILLVRSWRVPAARIRLAYSAVLLAIFLTHYVGAIFVLGFFLADAHHEWVTHAGFAQWRKRLSWLVSGYLVPLVGGMAWLPFFLVQRATHSSLGWVPNVPLERIQTSLHIFLFGAPVGVAGVPPALGYRVSWLTVDSVTLALVIAFTALVVWLTIRKKWDDTLRLAGFMAIFPLILTWALQMIHLQLYVERFLTGSAIFLTLFTVLALSRFTKPRYFLTAAAAYVALVLLVQPWTYEVRFPIVADTVAPSLATQEVIFTNAFDFTVGRFYLGEEYLEHIHLYNVNNLEESFYGWAMIRGQDITSLPAGPHVVVTPSPEVFPNYQVTGSIDGLHVMQPL